MSEVKVNKVSPRSGTTVTIGDSGDTINIVGTLQSNGSPLAGDISSVVAGTGLSGGATSGVATLNIEAAQPTITSLGTITGFTSTGIDDNATSTAITIDSGQNVGIGTATPNAITGYGALTIAGNTWGGFLDFEHGSTLNSSIVGASNGLNILTRINQPIMFKVNATEGMRLTSTGLSIGTTSASGFDAGGLPLLVGNGSTHQGLTIYTGTSHTGAIHFADGTGTASYRGQINYRHDTDALQISVAGSEKMRLTSTGLGIGTASPSVKLHILGTENNADTQAIRLMENSTQGGFIKYDGNTNELQLGGYNSGENTGIKIARNDATTMFNTGGSERMRIDSSGNVGIGVSSILTPSGSRKAVVISNGTNGGAIHFNNLGAEADNPRIFGKNSGTTDLSMAAGGSSGVLTFHTNSGTERMRIDSSGRILINTTSHIGTSPYLNIANTYTNSGMAIKSNTANAHHAIEFHNTNNQVGYINTSGTSTVYSTSSDYRLKENVSYDFDATTRLKQLKPARFNFIADADTTVDGFLAHEVSSVIPEAISGTKDAVQVWQEGDELPEGVSVGDNKLDENGNTIPEYQGIDQSKLVPLLVKTIQELEARITTLENA